MKQNKFIRASGPFEVHSISQDGEGVRLVVYPAFPKYNLSEKERAAASIEWQQEPRWAIHRYRGDGGGPGIFTAIALADALEVFLNQQYTADQVAQWKAANAEALMKVRAKDKRLIERALAVHGKRKWRVD